MEKDNHLSADHDAASLQLRSKEVSEAMGNIPKWIGTWGLFLLLFFFAASMFMMLNVPCVQRIRGKAFIALPQRTGPLPGEKPAPPYLQLVVEDADYNKMQKRQSLILVFSGEGKDAGSMDSIRLSLTGVKTGKGEHTLSIPLQTYAVKEMLQHMPGLISAKTDCQIVTEESVFKKVFGWLL